jgi:hypothetical protein
MIFNFIPAELQQYIRREVCSRSIGSHFEMAVLTGRRIALLFVYAFGSMTLPVLIGIATLKPSQEWTSAASWWAFAYLGYGLVQVFLVFPRMASWAAAVKPETNMSLSGEELRMRLLSLNDDKLPFVVTGVSKDADRLVAMWKIADEKWTELFAARGLRIQYELTLKILKEKRVVLARDNFRRFEYSGEVGRKGIQFTRQFSLFRGISFFQYERGLEYGVVYKNGKLKIDYAYDYRFDIAEVKHPIVQIVTRSGWEFRPVVFMH